MSVIIHSRRTPLGVRYREWSVETGRYVTGELSQVPMRRHLVATGATEDEADVAIRRALVSGTSEAGKTRNQDADWDAAKDAAASGAPAPAAEQPAKTSA